VNYYLNIGTNLGQRRDNLNRAVVALAQAFGGCVVSEVIESEPWGFDSSNLFLNIGVWIKSDKQPSDMLRWTQALEKELGSDSHRDDAGNYVDRLVDIDIMAIDEQVINTPQLTIPHPHLHERKFFLLPLAQLAPNWHHPILNISIEELLEQMDLA